MAYSHELSSCGFWPGGSAEGSFYAYAYPQPDGFADWPVEPDAAFYDDRLGEFILPYAAVLLPIPTRRSSRSSKAPTTRPPSWPVGTELRSRSDPERAGGAGAAAVVTRGR
jgi:hypothetical protein